MIPYRTDLKKISRILRATMTNSEQVLWAKLRRKQLRGIQFYRQKPIGEAIVDFFAPSARLVIEIDGSQHMSPENVERDKQRSAVLENQGLRVLRFNNLQVLQELDAVMEAIFRPCRNLKRKSPQSPLCQRGHQKGGSGERGDTNDIADIFLHGGGSLVGTGPTSFDLNGDSKADLAKGQNKIVLFSLPLRKRMIKGDLPFWQKGEGGTRGASRISRQHHLSCVKEQLFNYVRASEKIMTNKKSLLLSIVLIGFVYATMEGLSSIGLVFLQAKNMTYEPLPVGLSPEQKQLITTRIEDPIPLRGHHPVLGWSPHPHTHSEQVRINSQGIRAEKDYTHAVPPEMVRVSAFGDSFTFGNEVDNEDTWERQLENKNSRFEILNFGTGAYGLDQAFLRYQTDGVYFHSDIVVIGFMSENIYRNLNVWRPFYYSSYSTNIYTKPRFVLENGNLRLITNPLTTVEDYRRLVTHDEDVLREIGKHDYFYQVKYLAGPMDWLPSVRVMKIAARAVKERLNPVVTQEGSYAADSEAFRLTTRILDEFSCAALQHGSLPIVMIHPDLGDLRRQRNHQPRRYTHLLEHLQAKNVRYLDIMDAFIEREPNLPAEKLTVGKWGHYSPFGHAIVANHIHDYVNTQSLTTKDHIKALVDAVCSTNSCCTTS